MRVYGIDFTSAPRKTKPIVCSAGTFSETEFSLERIDDWCGFEPFELLLASSGPWCAGVDFPLSQPAELRRALAWPTDWQACLEHIGSMSKAEFTETLLSFSRSQPAGHKHLFRKTDRDASACSPMMVYGVPVAKMFYEGATRLAKSDCNIVPCRRREDSRTILETYPAIIARRCIARTSYKSATQRQDTVEKQAARASVIEAIRDGIEHVGITVRMDETLFDKCVRDATGDSLDSVLCCLLASWTLSKPEHGLPEQANDEGWIVNPFPEPG